MKLFLSLAFLFSLGANATCLPYSLNYVQKNDSYHWKITWKTGVPFETLLKTYTEKAGAFLPRHSEALTALRWTPQGGAKGTIEAWASVDNGFWNSKSYFVRDCAIGASSLFCKINLGRSSGAKLINWSWSKLSCAGRTCAFEESASVDGVMFVASPQKVSVGVASQSMRDVLRLALASEIGTQKLAADFSDSRSGLDKFWGEAQPEINNKNGHFTINTKQVCN